MDKLRDYFATWDGLEVIGHIDFEKVWEEAVRTADRKTEPQTCEECEHWSDTEDGCADRHGCKTEPQKDCTTCDQIGRCERGRAVECPMTERSE